MLMPSPKYDYKVDGWPVGVLCYEYDENYQIPLPPTSSKTEALTNHWMLLKTAKNVQPSLMVNTKIESKEETKKTSILELDETQVGDDEWERKKKFLRGLEGDENIEDSDEEEILEEEPMEV